MYAAHDTKPYPSLWAVVHPDGRLCWNYCCPSTNKEEMEERAKKWDDTSEPYRCMFGPHKVIEYRTDRQPRRICTGPGCTFGPDGVKHGPKCEDGLLRE